MSRRLPAGSPRTGWARVGRSCCCTASTRPGPAWSSHPSPHGWPSTTGSCWSTGSASAPLIGPIRGTARALYAEQLERIRTAALGPGETALDVVALSLPGQYVVVAAARHPECYGRIALISPTGFGRFKGSAGRTSRALYRFLRWTGIGRLLFAVLARRQVIRLFLRQTFADPERIPPEYERYCWRTCQQPGAFRAPLAFVSGLLNDPRAERAYTRLANPTLLVFGDHPHFTDPAASEGLLAANDQLRSVTIERAGDLPQLEQPDETATVVSGFLLEESAAS